VATTGQIAKWLILLRQFADKLADGCSLLGRERAISGCLGGAWRHPMVAGRGFQRTSLFVAGLLFTGGLAHAADVFVNFENCSDSEVLTHQISGIDFTDTIVLSAGISLMQVHEENSNPEALNGSLLGGAYLAALRTAAHFGRR